MHTKITGKQIKYPLHDKEVKCNVTYYFNDLESVSVDMRCR